MNLCDRPLFELDIDDVRVMGQYKLQESKGKLVVMSSHYEYEKHIGVAVVDTQLAIMRAAILSYM